MNFLVIVPLRILQVLAALAVLALSAYVADWYRSVTLASPAPVNFLIAAPIFTVFSLIYLELVTRVAPRSFHPYVALALEGFNALFYFAGFIALAVFLARLQFCRGSVCDAARADVVLASTAFVSWVATLALLALDVFKGGLRSGRGYHGRSSSSPPPVQPPTQKETV